MKLRLGVVAAAVSLVLAGGSAAASPVGIESDPPQVRSDQARLSSIGRGLLTVRGGVLVLSEADLGLTAVTFIAADQSGTRELQPVREVVVLGPVAASGNRMVAVDSAGQAAVEAGLVEDPLTPVVRLFQISGADGQSFVETGVAVLPEEIASGVLRFGISIAIGGNAIAVVSETTSRSDRVDVFRVSPEGTTSWSQELLPQTLRTTVAVSTSGATIAVSGVNRLAASGELIVNRIGPSGWIPTQRFLRIGGGAVKMDNDRILVQRNSFFARTSGPWTLVESSPGRPFEVTSELPVEGNSLDALGSVLVVGDANNDVAYLLEETVGGFRFSQAVRSGRTGVTGDPSLFGTAVALLEGDRMIVGAPGPGSSTPAGEVHAFSLLSGPVGCTVLGTDDNDEITVPAIPGQTVCALGGSDLVTGSSRSDVIYGGPGDDELTASPDGGTVIGGAGVDACGQSGPVGNNLEVLECER